MDPFLVRGWHQVNAAFGPACDPGKKERAVHISHISHLNNDVPNYTSIVCAGTCSYRSLRSYWLKCTAVDRPAALG